MNDKLRELIVQASTRIEAGEAERKAEKIRIDQAEQEADAEKFKRKVESVLGKEVLEAIGPVTFHRSFLSQSMTFEQDSRTFRLQQVTGFLVQLEETGIGGLLGRQFNLDNTDSKDTFLDSLGAALRAGPHKGSGAGGFLAVAPKRGPALGQGRKKNPALRQPRNAKNLRPS